MPTLNSPFLQAVGRPRQKGFAEQILDDITNMSTGQALALPLTLPATAGAGAIEGLSFGLLNPTDELETFLGDYAPPKPLQTAAEIAGVIGGSFVPYIGASSLASKMFTGIGLGQRLARGAITFGAPELLRQALTQELDPLAGGRSLATGAAFSLPLPRLALAPAVAATELLFGAEPIEAGVSAGFAALFGAMGPEAKKIAAESVAASRVPLEAEGLLGELVRQRRQPPPFTRTTGTGFGGGMDLGTFGGQFTANVPVTARPATEASSSATKPISKAVEAAISPLTRAAQSGKILTKREREALATGQLELQFGEVPAPKSQVELILETAGKADLPEASVSLRQLAQNVKALADQPEEQLANALVKAVDVWGPDASQTKGLQFALAEKRRGYVPPNALAQNPLKPPVLGVETITPGPTNPFEMRAQHEDVLATLRQTGGLSGKTKAAQLEDLMYEARQEAARAKAQGRPLTPQRMAEIQAEHDRITANQVVTFRDDAEALKAVTAEMSKTMKPADVDDFVRTLPSYYQREPAFMTRVQQAAAERKTILQGLSRARAFLPAETPEFAKLRTAAADYGAQTELEAGRVVLRHGGQEIRSFRSPQEAETWLRALETGDTTPADPVRTLAAMRHQLETEGTILGHHGTSTARKERILAEDFRPFNSEQEFAEALKASPIETATWRRLPQGLREDAKPMGFTGEESRAGISFSSDAAYSMEYAAQGGEFQAETALRLKLIDTALRAGYKPAPADRLDKVLNFLDEQGLRMPKAVEIRDPLRQSVILADIKVSPGEREILLQQLDEALANPPQDEAGLQDLLSRLYTEIRVAPKDIKIRRAVQDPRNTLKTWENLPVEGGVNSVQELNMLAHSRGMVADWDGKGIRVVTQMTGQNIYEGESLVEAAKIIRSSTNMAEAAARIGPHVPGDLHVPGGSMQGLRSTQPANGCFFTE